MQCHATRRCNVHISIAHYIFFSSVFCCCCILHLICMNARHMHTCGSHTANVAAKRPTSQRRVMRNCKRPPLSLSLSFPMLFHANEVEWHSNSNIIRSTMISSSGKQTLNEKKPTERNRDNNNKKASRMQLQAHSKIAIFRKRLLSIILIMQ